jgi:hypothetical protein
MRRVPGCPAAFPCLAVALLLACNSETLTEPAIATLRIEITVTGDDLAANGFTLQIDDSPTQSIFGGESRLQAVAPRGHRVTLGDIVDNRFRPMRLT